MKRYDLIVVGAGPAGLSAAVEAANAGMRVIVFDENDRPGGQLFKQIHKFFGSKEQHAKTRGITIGQELLKEAGEAGIQVELGAVVTGIFQDRSLSVMKNGRLTHYAANATIVATGASERTIPFEGWTLPGVIGAGAAQTMMNLHGVRPGKKVMMLGSGNVGLVVGFQLLQAGCEVVALVDAAPRIGGYGVHAAKLSRMGVPFYLSHTIVKAHGQQTLTGVTIGEVDASWSVLPGTEKYIEADVICMAVGLNPMNQLLRMAGVEMKEAGGLVPVCNAYGETSVPGLFAAGDVARIEEASSAMIGGRIAGLAAAKKGGFLDGEAFETRYRQSKRALAQMRQGMFSPENRGRTDLTVTDEGIPLSHTLLTKGYVQDDEIERFPGVERKKGIHPVIECTQNIPCNPCQDACKFGCIRVGNVITALPGVVENANCQNCGMCVASCSGQAIFLVNEDFDAESATVTIPYELLPLPKKGDPGTALGRDGRPLCDCEILQVRTAPAFDKTALITMRVPKRFAMTARFFTRKEQVKGEGRNG